MRYRVYTAPSLIESLRARFPEYPIKAILIHLREQLEQHPTIGTPAPMPFAEGVLFFETMCEVGDVTYTIRSVYQLDHKDVAVELLDLSVE